MLELDRGFVAYSLAERPELHAATRPIVAASWPEFMFHDPVGDDRWPRLATDLPAHQYAVLDAAGELVGLGNSIPIRWSAGEPLPEDGWRWALIGGFDALDAGRTPTAVSALAIQVDPARRGQGIAAIMVDAMRRLTAAAGYADLVAPVRPNRKPDYPLIPIDDYWRWTTPADEPFDPWLRVHARAGARLVGPCHRSMEITGMVTEWEEWAGLPMPASGDYVVPGALVPVHVDRAADRGDYVEPNVWVHHTLGE